MVLVLVLELVLVLVLPVPVLMLVLVLAVPVLVLLLVLVLPVTVLVLVLPVPVLVLVLVDVVGLLRVVDTVVMSEVVLPSGNAFTSFIVPIPVQDCEACCTSVTISEAADVLAFSSLMVFILISSQCNPKITYYTTTELALSMAASLVLSDSCVAF